MYKFGFQLVELRLIGSNIKDSYVEFKPGLNVITGPSETGKSFILDCIDYVLGKAKTPKKIAEIKGYDEVILKIRVNVDRKNLIFKRDLKNNKSNIELNNNGVTTSLKYKLDKNNNNISTYLLDLIGLSNKKLKKNNSNKVENLSYRDINCLVLIDEKRIIQEKSPFYSDNIINNTKYSSLIKLLLSGCDDSNIVEVDKKRKEKIIAKNELILNLIKSFESEIPKLCNKKNIEMLDEEIKALDLKFDETESRISAFKAEFILKENIFKALREDILKNENRKSNIEDFSLRLDLLEQHYKSDLERVEAVAEVSEVFFKIDNRFCPKCGLNLDEKLDENYNFHEIIEACNTEKIKISNLNYNLMLTKKSIFEEKSNLDIEIEKNKLEYKNIEEEIENLLKPIMIKSIEELIIIKESIFKLKEINYKKEKIIELEKMICPTNFNKIEKSEIKIDEDIYFDELSDLLIKNLNLLNIDKSNKVIFNKKNFDFVINGKDRNVFGKGVRAILFSIIIVSLFEYCKKKNTPHPGFIVLDSPLVAYEEPEKNNNDLFNFDQNFKDYFYSILSKEFSDDQLIIIENTTPPSDIKANIIKFSKNSSGRYGFIENLN